jgi:hypothetical protein
MPLPVLPARPASGAGRAQVSCHLADALATPGPVDRSIR